MTDKELINQYVTAHADNRWMDASELEALLTEFAEEMKAKQVAAIKCEKKSPITGGEMQLMQEESSVKFRGEEISFIKKFYHCVDSGQDFTDTELDNDNMWTIFRAYWERKGFEHFYDIDGYREEQKSASEDFESEWKRYCDSKGGGAVTMNVKDVAKHFAQWQREQMMKDAIAGEVKTLYRHIVYVESVGFDSGSIDENKQEVFAGDKVKIIMVKDND